VLGLAEADVVGAEAGCSDGAVGGDGALAGGATAAIWVPGDTVTSSGGSGA
jgi:hypothetical protein